MKLGCCAYSYRDYLKDGEMSLEQFVETCSALGLDGVELTAYYFPTTEATYLRELKRFVFTHGLHIAGTAVGSDFCLADEAERRHQVQMTKEWIDHSVILGAPCIRVFAGPVPTGHSYQEAVGWAVECLKECAAYGGERGVVVALENHGGITATADQVLKLHQAVQHPWFGLNLDCGNFHNAYDEIEKVAPYAVTCHAKVSYPGRSGKEVLDYYRVTDILQKAGYKGYLNIEYEEKEDTRKGVEEFTRQLQAVLRSLVFWC